MVTKPQRSRNRPQDLIVDPGEGDFSAPYGPLAFFLDLHPPLSDFRADALEGLSRPRKSLPAKYLYDEYGSKLFEQITRLDSYYPTRIEREIVAANADAIADAIGPERAVFEYGSGSSEKIGRLLSLMRAPKGYVAMDISREHLIANAGDFAEATALPVGAVCGDFLAPVPIPDGAIPDARGWLGFFPGSTIGNLGAAAAAGVMTEASATLGADALFLIGFDLEKDPAVLLQAYDEDEGVTARFILNILSRLRAELHADLDPDDFAYRATVEAAPQRVEMFVEAARATEIGLEGRRFPLARGERIHISKSRKFTPDGFNALLAATPWRGRRQWVAPRSRFATCLLSNNQG